MGDPRRLKNKYNTPFKPWHGPTIEIEAKIKKDFGLKNKREIYLANTFLKKYKDIAKNLIANKSAQAEKEKRQVLDKLERLGLLPIGSKLDNILNLEVKDVLGRRLQTRVHISGLARSITQARQFITHRHITVAGNQVTAPSYLLTIEEESQLGFKPTSALQSVEHPERINAAKEIHAEAEAVKPKKKTNSAVKESTSVSLKESIPAKDHKEKETKEKVAP